MTAATLQLSPKTIYHRLRWLDEMDILSGAQCREMANQVMADPTVRLSLRQAIANRLNLADRLIEVRTIKGDDSY
jgi:hypothetical protein